MTPRGNEKAGRANGNGQGSARRTELLALAAELFATRGFSQTTVRDIADAAGILSGSLYHHFDSKESMLNEILREFLTGLHDTFRTIVDESGTPRETLDELVRASFVAIDGQRHAVALYQNESNLLMTQPEFEVVAKTSRKIERVWLQVLVQGRESGDFRADLESGVIYRFIRDGVWSAVKWYNPRGKLRHDKVAEQYLAMLHGGLLAG
ncbi:MULTISPECIES: TetR/AcrR family transcriptional regulator [unclassified Nocardioides]|uniref:TetR/AcrR family transcriptional regulator n=1 Tax=unclassified Nocardioides TaxID=2615069 RepID=UPI0006F5B200|nr:MULTISPECIES: TetR/AcrR family transcriptional regulator [unclassified Nocardioides]KQY54262.1 TetR family transcriptional regulator [Nocardioides sp. Root140]KQZ74883.1 TetR family transcriptional regulator [Nocardioides sp. Root151]KRF10417.1 TetR family transcriptional regulator [Nocardioides sp. Soil796]